jgi:hypothetical protein
MVSMKVLRKSMSLRSAVLILHSVFLAVVLSACAEKKSQRSGEEYTVPREYIFAVAYDAAWKGTVQALSEAERIQSLDKESGLIVTEVKEINNLVQTFVPTAMFGKVYKNGYTLHLREVASGETRISIRSNLTLTQL